MAETSLAEEQLLLKNIIKYIKEKKHKVQALWFGEENLSCGAIISGINDEYSVVSLHFDSKILRMPQIGSFVILRVFFFFLLLPEKLKK